MFRLISAFISLLYIQLYLPLFFIIYTPLWNNYALPVFSRSDKVGGINVIRQYDHELRLFFIHKVKLSKPKWSDKDKQHLSEVRKLYDLQFIFFTLMLILAIYSLREKQNIKKSCFLIYITIALLMLIMPFFKFVWKEIFHSLLFDNNLWKMKKTDMCYYLFPKRYFRATIIFMILSTTLTNSILFIKSRK